MAISLGLSNFAAAIGIGVSGIDARTRWRVGVVFGVFETAMPVLGLLLGRGLASTLGQAAHWIGAALLIATGLYALVQAFRGPHREQGQASDGHRAQGSGRLLLTGVALSIDNLAVGFALGTFHLSLAVAAILTGLELGHRIGTKTGDRGEVLGGLVLIGVGLAVAAGILLAFWVACLPSQDRRGHGRAIVRAAHPMDLDPYARVLGSQSRSRAAVYLVPCCITGPDGNPSLDKRPQCPHPRTSTSACERRSARSSPLPAP